MSRHTDVEAALRASLAAHSHAAPAGAALAERIIAEVEHLPVDQRQRVPRWRTWTLPLVAAASVAAVAGALVVVGQREHQAERQPPAHSPTATVPSSSMPSSSMPTSRVPTPTKTASTTPAPVSSAPAPQAVTVAGVTGFQAVDLSFVGPDDGWALGYADCVSDPGRACTSMARTTDGGAHWRSLTPPPVNLPMLTCDVACAEHIRFADDQVGYVFGASVLYATTDGGGHWTRQSGGADALETLDGNVIRLVSDHSGCPGPCNLRVELAAIGSSVWTTVSLPGGPVDAAQLTLARTGSRAFLLTRSGQAGVVTFARLFTSADDGRTWSVRADPCQDLATAGTVTHAYDLSSAPDGSVSLLCSAPTMMQVGQAVTTTSRDGGTQFTPGQRAQFGLTDTLVAASADVLIVAGDQPMRSVDGGHTWVPVLGSGPAVANVRFAGFETPRVGRVVTDGGHTVWTTRDAGRTWTGQTFR